MVSKRRVSPQPLFLFLLFALLFSLQVLPRLSEDSPAADEPIDIADGFYYWKGDVISAAEHPPLAKALQALPLEFLNLKFKSDLHFSMYDQRDWHFLFVLNYDRWPLLFFLARGVSWLFGLGIGFLLYWMARKGSMVFLAIVLCLWSFEPSLLAFSGLAMADIPLTFIFLAAVWFFQKAAREGNPGGFLKTGLLAGMAVTTKFTAGLLVPVFGVLEIIGILKDKKNFKTGVAVLKRWAWMGAAACAWIFVIYLPGTFCVTEHHWPFYYFFEGLKSITYSAQYFGYFKGQLQEQSHWDYYPMVFAEKSPLSLSLLLATAVGLAWAKRIKIPIWQWIAPLVFFTALAPFHDIGIRMILPIYPFLFLIAARAGEWMWNRRPQGSRVFPILLVGLLGFQALSVGLSFPSQISYFNELVPQDRKIYWLGDSNLDIGQDTKRLAEEGRRRGWSHVKLAYFGNADPSWYGMDWKTWTQKDLAGPQPGWVYAINAAFIQLAPAYNPEAPAILNSWISKVPPTGQFGDTWYYFEVPGEIKPDHSPDILSVPFLNRNNKSN
jgi:Dolichyl-phosphate-mannose-protein mannosyltransferase